MTFSLIVVLELKNNVSKAVQNVLINVSLLLELIASACILIASANDLIVCSVIAFADRIFLMRDLIKYILI